MISFEGNFVILSVVYQRYRQGRSCVGANVDPWKVVSSSLKVLSLSWTDSSLNQAKIHVQHKVKIKRVSAELAYLLAYLVATLVLYQWCWEKEAMLLRM